MSGEPQSGEVLRLGPIPRGHLALVQGQKRRLSRERIHAQVVHPIDTPSLMPDPLWRRDSRAHSAISGARLVVGAAVIHGVVVLGFAALGQLIGQERSVRPSERVKIAILASTPPPAAPEPIRRAAPLSPEFAPPTPPKKVDLVPRKAVEPASTSQETAAAPDPIPRRVVGLSLESTVLGQGPAFASGTTRMGKTDDRAEDPKRATKAPAPAPGPAAPEAGRGTPQRAATHIPTRDAQFEKPQRARPSTPEYPATLKAQNVEGDVVVSVDIAVTGKVTRVSILRSSGQAAFDDAARRAALGEEFTPALRDGVPVAYTISYTYHFRIED